MMDTAIRMHTAPLERRSQAGQRARRQQAGPCHARSAKRRAQHGQTLLEFALVLMLFMLVTVGLLDGLRVVFYYTQIQEAAREGARWGAVQVNRLTPGGNQTVGGTFDDWGNKPATYCDAPLAPCDRSLQSSRTAGSGAYSTTIVGAVTQATTAVNLAQATITVSTTIPAARTETLTQYDNRIADQAVTVAVVYPFKPLLSMVFGGVTINLKGSSTMLHE